MEEKLKQLFSEVLGIEKREVNDELKFNDTSEWDSLTHMSLVAAIDDEFDIMLETEDVIDMSSFKKAKEILAKYGIEQE